MPGYGLFPCRDGNIVIAATADRVGTLVTDVLDEPDLFPLPGREDPGRRAHVDKVTEKVIAWTKERTVAEAHAALRVARIPSEPVRDMETIWSDEQLEARGMFLEYEYRGFGTIKTVGSPLHLSESPVEVRHTPPEAGQHNDEILTQLCGYDEQRITELIDAGVLWGEG